MKYEPNRIYCADCYEVIKDVPDKSIDLIYTDIPYDFEANGGGECFGEKKRDYHGDYEAVAMNTQKSRVWRQAYKSYSDNADIAFGIDYAILNEFCRVLKNIYVYIWCSKKQILPLMQFFVGENGKTRNTLFCSLMDLRIISKADGIQQRTAESVVTEYVEPDSDDFNGFDDL